MNTFVTFALALGICASSPAHAKNHLYQIKVYVDTEKMNLANMLPEMDENGGIANDGNLSLVLQDLDTKQTILTQKTDDSVPVFNVSTIYQTNRDFLNVSILIRDRDWMLLAPWTWGWGTGGNRGPTDDIAHIAAFSLAPSQNAAVSAYAFSSTETIRILTNSQQQINYSRTNTAGRVLESRTITTVDEYQTIVNRIGGTAYNIEITRLR